ncbi:energy-coupling factor transporter transmembrane component T family protein [Arthrobacter burdickii]|uniref:Energy-coupling factor transporter transmembrane component T n=1 Tax=Arthrobacter burdickii TaxID=3035920 RepID=A0ABT8K2M8_9MICC|nr:energy-coupling factor transporter transmembrane component T [Arthrobacter burdickii]MDN4611680.1 energy-coupling factor transporter transmembrane component T [Arthrobacter burdickii]
MRGFGSTLGLYERGHGFLYRLPLPLKAGASLACAVAVVAWRSPETTAVALAVTAGALLAGARLSPARVLRMLLPAAPVLGILALYQGVAQGWLRAFVVVGGIVACLLAARAVTLTTPTQDLLDGVVRLVRPFRRLGADPERFALALSIMLRSIPYLAGLFVDVREAARARGLDRSPRVAVTPLVVGAVAYAHRTGEALAARGLGDHEDDEPDEDGDPGAAGRRRNPTNG